TIIRNPKGRNRRHSKQRIENLDLDDLSEPIDTMADQRTMAQLLQAPTEGYEDAIVVPAITTDNFELKHGLLTLVQNKQLLGHDKEDPHAHVRYFNKITSTLKFLNVPNTSIKLMLFPFSLEELHQLDTFYNALNSKDQDSLNSAAGGNFLDRMPRECLGIIESKSKVRYSRNKPVVAKTSTTASTSGVSPDVTELKDMVIALLLDKKGQSPAPVKAVEESCVTCGGAHSYRNFPATDGNNYRDNIQEFVSQASAVNFNQGYTGYRPQMMSNYIRPPGFPPVPNNQNLQRNNQNRFIPNQNQNRGNVEDKILVPKPPKNCARCAKCGNPVNGPYCQGCALLREKLEEDLVTYLKYFQDTSESSDDSTNVVNAPREPVVVKKDHGVNPPHIDKCCCECGNALDGIFCQQCICKSCGKGAHTGYNYPSKIPAWCDDDDDYDSAITPVLSTEEPMNSLNIGDEHLDTMPATESNKVIKSSVKDLVPIPSESEGKNGCDVPSCFTTFSNILFDADYDFESVDNQSLHNEDVSEKIFSNPLFEEEIISIRIDQHHFNAEADLDSDSHMEEIDLSFNPDDPMPPSIKDDDNDSEGDNLFLERLFHDDPIPLPDTLDFSNVVRVFLPFFTYPVTSSILFSSGSKDTIFDPGITIYHFYSF
nr:hypothetical protein [Tanacetum cinerariifolium]